MHPYVLSWISAFMLLIGLNSAFTINIQPIPPFSGNFLNDVADFQNIVEPNSINSRQRYDSKNMGEAEIPEFKINQEYERCALHHNHTSNDKPLNLNETKRQLHQIGKIYLSNYLDNEGEKGMRRIRRQEDDVQDEEILQQPVDDEAASANAVVGNLTLEAKNITDSENYQSAEDNAANICCEDDKKDYVAPKNYLEMHVYKVAPDKAPSLNKNKDILTVNLYPEKHGSKLPKKYDYIALFANGQKLSQVPALKFNLVSNNNEKRTSHYVPFTNFRYKKHSLKDNAQSKRFNDLLKVIDSSKLRYENIARIPVLFINTMPSFQSGKTETNKKAKITKRDSALNENENKYLVEANSLIQNLNASLQSGDSSPAVNAGILIYPKYEELNLLPDLPNKEQATTAATFEALNLVNNNLEPSLLKDDRFISDEQKYIPKSVVNSAEILQNKDSFKTVVSSPDNVKNSKIVENPSAQVKEAVEVTSTKEINPADLELLLKSVTSHPATTEQQKLEDLSNVKVQNLIKNTETLKYADPKLNFGGELQQKLEESSKANNEATLHLSVDITTVTVETVINTQQCNSTETTGLNMKINDSDLAANINLTSLAVTSLPSSMNSTQNSTANSETVNCKEEIDSESVLDLLANMSTVKPNSNNNLSTSQENLVTSSVPTISAQGITQTPTVGTVEYSSTGAPGKNNSILKKLQNLQKDLKLVFEVQNILSGSKKSEKKTNRRKRDANFVSIDKRNCKKHKENKIHETNSVELKPEKIREIQQLGKILEYKKMNEAKDCEHKDKRFLFRSKKRKNKRKKKKKRRKKHWWNKLFRSHKKPDHFLGQNSQNYH